MSQRLNDEQLLAFHDARVRLGNVVLEYTSAGHAVPYQIVTGYIQAEMSEERELASRRIDELEKLVVSMKDKLDEIVDVKVFS